MKEKKSTKKSYRIYSNDRFDKLLVNESNSKIGNRENADICVIDKESSVGIIEVLEQENSKC